MNFSGISGHRKQTGRMELMALHNKVPQTILFTGPSGIGKKLIARRFLAALFCREENAPCLRCVPCLQIEKGIHPDYIELSPNEKGIIPVGTEEKKEPGSVRSLIDRLSRRSITGARAVLIDGIEGISEEGQNALLKTVEEPASSTKMILITSSKAQVLPTIVSRSFEIAFNPLSDRETAAVLASMGHRQEDTEAAVAAAGGSPGTALLLTAAETRNQVFGICGEISRFLSTGATPALAIDKPQKLLGQELFIDVLINIYRINLLSLVNGNGPVRPEFAGLFLKDGETIQRLVKILLALKKGLSNNLNIRIALKGMLYSLYSGTLDDNPGARFDYSI